MTTQVKRKVHTVSVSIPLNLIAQVDEIADAMNINRSKLISNLLKEFVSKRKDALLIEGYKAMAEQHREFAELSVNAAREALPPWEQ